jgi:hypothetical protein
VKFNSLNFELFSLNINPFPTLQSLAFGIFRSISVLNKVLRFILEPKNLVLNLKLLFSDPTKNPIMNPVATQMLLK